MRWRWGRLLVAVLLAEGIPILLLIALVAAFGPGERIADQAFAERLGRWVGPIAGALSVLVAARWVARDLSSGRVAHGVALGAAAALLDVALLVAGGAGFAWLFVVSQVGRLVAGYAGGASARAGA
jgi:hypothetical protein